MSPTEADSLIIAPCGRNRRLRIRQPRFPTLDFTSILRSMQGFAMALQQSSAFTKTVSRLRSLPLLSDADQRPRQTREHHSAISLFKALSANTHPSKQSPYHHAFRAYTFGCACHRGPAHPHNQQSQNQSKLKQPHTSKTSNHPLTPVKSGLCTVCHRSNQAIHLTKSSLPCTLKVTGSQPRSFSA